MPTAKLGPESIVQRIEGISVTGVEDGVFLMNVNSGYLFKLNQTAQSVWELLVEPLPVNQLCRRVADKYGVSEADSIADISELLNSLCKAGLIRIQNAATYGTVE